MRFVIICLFLFVFQCFYAQLQDDSLSFNDTQKFKRVSYKVPLLSILDFTAPSLNFGIELRISKSFGLHQEVGFVSNFINPLYYSVQVANLDDDERRVNNGFKYWIEPRWYFFKDCSSMFIAPSFNYRYNVYNHDEWLFRNSNNGGFRQKYEFSRRFNYYAFLLKYGDSIETDFNFSVEIYLGIGYRILNISESENLPGDARLGNNNSFFSTGIRRSGSYFGVAAQLGLALKFNKKE